MKPPLLFLCHRLPIPPNKGDKIRSFNMLKFLSQHYTVYLAGFIDDKNDLRYVDELQTYCADYLIEEKSSLVSMLRGLTGFISRSAITLPYYFSPSLKSWVKEKTKQHNIQRTFVYSSAMAQYAMPNTGLTFTQFVMDFVDVDSDKWRQYALKKQGIARWFYNREAKCLEDYEVDVFEQASSAAFVSSQEAKFFNTVLEKRGFDLNNKQALAINNGVDAEFFRPEQQATAIHELGDQACVFTGAMDYWPNIAAIVWFVEQVWPHVLTAHPNAVLAVVGSNPSEEIRALNKQNSIIVTGRVEDVRPYIQQANIVIAPLQIARGIQNKVLEGMAMSKEIVLTKLAGEGICVDSMPGYHICESAQQYISTINTLLQSLGKEVTENRSFVQRHFDWHTELEKLKGMIG